MTTRRPVVAVLDTGIGEHPWFDGGIVTHDTALTTFLTDATDSPDAALQGQLSPDFGHGTFVAGLVRQLCPDADLLDVPIGSGDGVLRESEMLHLFRALLIRQVHAQRANNPGELIDVVCLSFGYYDEQPEDVVFDHKLAHGLHALAKVGISVVASAGNDATYRCFYPAAYSPYPGGVVPAAEHDAVPLISVGALNPNRRSVALFSNAGKWVACHRPGAALVSTFPKHADGSQQPMQQTYVAGDGMRATIDPDDFTCGPSGGFGTWSGTSFSSPVLAGELAQAQLDSGDLDLIDPASCIERAWNAVTTCVGLDRP
jgi:subtilisin family serine protease